jgi:hypothetical protein
MLGQDQVPGHPQVDGQRRAVVKPEDQVFSTPLDIEDSSALEADSDVFRGVVAQDPGKVAQANGGDAGPDYIRDQRAAHCLDLWEFWHTGSTSSP